MAETVRGGRYVGEDGRWYDAEGRLIENALAAKDVDEQAPDPELAPPAPEPELAPPAPRGRRRP